MKSSLILLLVIVCSVLLTNITSPHQSFVAGTDCTLTGWLQEIQQEYSALNCTLTKLQMSINVLSNSSAIYNTRTKQLQKIKTAMESIVQEISSIQTKCTLYGGANCDQKVPWMKMYVSFNGGTFLDEINNLPFTNTGVTISSASPKSASAGSYGVFDGSGYAVSAQKFAFGNGNSISMWIKKNYLQDSNAGIAWSFDSSPGGYFEFTGGSYFKVYNADNSPILTSTSVFNNDNWHHVVLVCRTNGADLYIDGTLCDTSVTPFGMKANQANPNGYPMVFGRNYIVSSYPWKGAIDDIKVFDTPLTASDVQSIYQKF